MSTQASGDAAASPWLRVILVGRTGLEAALRLDPAIELVRARTAVEAVGELADRIDEESPEAVTVVVGHDADPGDEARAFVEGLRIVEPKVRVVVVGESARGVYDEAVQVTPQTPPETIRRVVRTPGPSPRAPVGTLRRAAVSAADEEAPEPPAPPAAPPPGTGRTGPATDRDALAAGLAVGPLAPAAPGRSEPRPGVRGPGSRPDWTGPAAPETPAQAQAGEAAGDAELVEALLTGRDVLLAALHLLRVRCGTADVFFHAEGAEGLPAESVPVEHAGRVFGRLASASVAERALGVHAAWLGRWLALRDQHAQLRSAAFTDDLTGAYNRRYFARYLGVALERGRQARQAVTLLVFDIDDFKQYNDRYGHAAGDEILRETVRLLGSVIRPSDRVCRIGGDEFAVIFFDPEGPRSGTPGEGGGIVSVLQIAERFQQQIHEHRFPKLGEQAAGTLTISGGVAVYPWDGRTVEELLWQADELALRSKRQGKNVITLGPGGAAGTAQT
ncbi:MAG TPA: GGDEF domain-containing protein [Phycisphaerales bacterium]|nr:GGDEF domain-containing protein [Phycisphaerales bacterium]